jgi:dipeptidyl aminopeptidase/acylaminoacyl peptidase
LKERSIREQRHVKVEARDGSLIDAFIIDPPGGTSVKAPLVAIPHGGPHAADGHSFRFMGQVLASHGFRVLYCNPPGSQSYSRKFSYGTRGDWGGSDVKAFMDVLDAVTNAYPTSNIALVGGSYAGFMAAKILGDPKYKDRFATGVVIRGVSNVSSLMYAGDSTNFLRDELRLKHLDAKEWKKYGQFSPLRDAGNINVPLLVMHSEHDHRVPVDQGDALFSRAILDDKNVEYVRFTGDGHALASSGRPSNRIAHLRVIANWLLHRLDQKRDAGVDTRAGWPFEYLPTEIAPMSERSRGRASASR